MEKFPQEVQRKEADSAMPAQALAGRGCAGKGLSSDDADSPGGVRTGCSRSGYSGSWGYQLQLDERAGPSGSPLRSENCYKLIFPGNEPAGSWQVD